MMLMLLLMRLMRRRRLPVLPPVGAEKRRRRRSKKKTKTKTMTKTRRALRRLPSKSISDSGPMLGASTRFRPLPGPRRSTRAGPQPPGTARAPGGAYSGGAGGGTRTVTTSFVRRVATAPLNEANRGA